MKKLVTIYLVAIATLTGFGQTTLPNGDFESWTQTSHGYYDPDGGFFKTLNQLDTIPTPSGLTCLPTTEVHSGEKAAMVVTQQIAPLEVLIPGVVGTIKIKWVTLNAALGIPYPWATKPERFQGWHKSNPILNDSTAVVLVLSRWNSSQNRRDTIATAKEVYYDFNEEYEFFDIPLDYRIQTLMPDSITVLLLSCAGFNAVDMMASVGQVGSQAYYDDVTLTNVSGIDYMLMPSVDVRLSPNPVADVATFTLNKLLPGGTIEFYTLQGQFVSRVSLNGSTTQVNVSELPAGIFFFKIMQGSNVMNTGSFVISR